MSQHKQQREFGRWDGSAGDGERVFLSLFLFLSLSLKSFRWSMNGESLFSAGDLHGVIIALVPVITSRATGLGTLGSSKETQRQALPMFTFNGISVSGPLLDYSAKQKSVRTFSGM